MKQDSCETWFQTSNLIQLNNTKIEDRAQRKSFDFNTACHSGKLKLAFTSPGVISTGPKNFLTSRIDLTVLLLFKFLKKNITCILGKLKTELTSSIAKSTSPGYWTLLSLHAGGSVWCVFIKNVQCIFNVFVI